MSYISELIEENSSLIKIGLIIIIVILLIILVLILIRHFKIPRKEHRVFRRRISSHLERIEKLRHLNEEPKEKLLLLDKIILSYLSNIVKINKKEGYEKISRKLKERGDSELADFCNRMEYYMYGNVEVSNRDIINLINEFESLVKFKIRNLEDNQVQIIQKNLEKTKKIEKMEEKEIIKKNSDKSSANTTKGFFEKYFSDREDYKKNKEIQKFRKLWYPDEK